MELDWPAYDSHSGQENNTPCFTSDYPVPVNRNSGLKGEAKHVWFKNEKENHQHVVGFRQVICLHFCWHLFSGVWWNGSSLTSVQPVIEPVNGYLKWLVFLTYMYMVLILDESFEPHSWSFILYPALTFKNIVFVTLPQGWIIHIKIRQQGLGLWFNY